MLYIHLFSPWICGYVHPGSGGQVANPLANSLRIPGKWAYDLEVAQLEGWMWPGFVREILIEHGIAVDLGMSMSFPPMTFCNSSRFPL